MINSVFKSWLVYFELCCVRRMPEKGHHSLVFLVSGANQICGVRNLASNLENLKLLQTVFVLKTIVDKFLTRKKGRFYCLLVNFSKAFDCVNRDNLIYTLIKNSTHGKMLKLIVMLSVKTKQGFTKQRCLLCPELFILFINELE